MKPTQVVESHDCLQFLSVLGASGWFIYFLHFPTTGSESTNPCSNLNLVHTQCQLGESPCHRYSGIGCNVRSVPVLGQADVLHTNPWGGERPGRYLQLSWWVCEWSWVTGRRFGSGEVEKERRQVRLSSVKAIKLETLVGPNPLHPSMSFAAAPFRKGPIACVRCCPIQSDAAISRVLYFQLEHRMVPPIFSTIVIASYSDNRRIGFSVTWV